MTLAHKEKNSNIVLWISLEIARYEFSFLTSTFADILFSENYETGHQFILINSSLSLNLDLVIHHFMLHLFYEHINTQIQEVFSNHIHYHMCAITRQTFYDCDML